MFATMRRPNVKYEEAINHICNLMKQQVDDYAAKATSVLGFRPGDDIISLVQQLGGRIHYIDLLDAAADEDTIFVHGHSDFDIILSSISSPNRDRFTIAHELGHYLLHSRQGAIPLVAARSGSNRAEWEANWFAAGFLMPAREFAAAFRSGKRVFELASAFAVSEAAAAVRIKALGLK